MPHLFRFVVRRCRSESFGLLNLPLSAPATIGDLGHIIGVNFATGAESSLADLGIPFNVESGDSHVDIEWKHTADSEMEVVAKAAGTPLQWSHLADAEAGVALKFGAVGSFILAAEKVQWTRLAESSALYSALAAARERKQIRAHDRLVTMIGTATNYSVFISRTNKSTLACRVNASVKELLTGKVDVSATLAYESGAMLRQTGAGPAPLFVYTSKVLKSGHLAPKFVGNILVNEWGVLEKVVDDEEGED